MKTADTSDASIQARLEALSSGTLLYALVDLANIGPDAPRLHQSFSALGAQCIFDDLAPAAQLVSPWLMPIRQFPSHDALKRSVELAKRSSAVTWIVSDLSGAELANRLRLRTEARLPDHYDVLLRHFDPRVLPVLYEVLNDQQKEAFFALGAAWLCLDRAGGLAEIPLTPEGAVDRFTPPLLLSDNQAAALLDAAEIDALMPELVKEEPDRFLALGGGPARYAFTRRCLDRARQWSLEQFPQKVVFCTLALRLGQQFDEDAAWQRELGHVAKTGMRLSEAIERVLGATSGKGEPDVT